MKLLLDTHMWLWSLLEPARISARVASALEAPGTELWLSPISVWETMILIQRGRLRVDGDPVTWINSSLRASPTREAPLTREVAIRSAVVKLPHRDPADRFLAATALVQELTLVTADRRLLRSREYKTLANR